MSMFATNQQIKSQHLSLSTPIKRSLVTIYSGQRSLIHLL